MGSGSSRSKGRIGSGSADDSERYRFDSSSKPASAEHQLVRVEPPALADRKASSSSSKAKAAQPGHSSEPPTPPTLTRGTPGSDSASFLQNQSPFWLLFLDPPQQKLENNDTNHYSWDGATPTQERNLYRTVWTLLQDPPDKDHGGLGGLARKLLDVLREESDERFPIFVGGCVPLNHYLVHHFGAPSAIPSNDIDAKADFGVYMRQLLAARADVPTTDDKAQWSDAERAAFQECFAEALAGFVEFAKRVLERMRVVMEEALPQIAAALAPLGIRVGPQGAMAVHKTHAAARNGKPPLNLVPLSGGVFQLVVELVPPDAVAPAPPTGAARTIRSTPSSPSILRGGIGSSGGGAAQTFIWNVVDLESDWKSAKVCGAPTPVEVATDDPWYPEHGLRLLAPGALRIDLDGQYQESKAHRRELKRAYWDWAKAWNAESTTSIAPRPLRGSRASHS